MDPNSQLAQMAQQFTLLRGELTASDEALASLILACEVADLKAAIDARPTMPQPKVLDRADLMPTTVSFVPTDPSYDEQTLMAYMGPGINHIVSVERVYPDREPHVVWVSFIRDGSDAIHKHSVDLRMLPVVDTWPEEPS